jgi:hypothetical protein
VTTLTFPSRRQAALAPSLKTHGATVSAASAKVLNFTSEPFSAQIAMHRSKKTARCATGAAEPGDSVVYSI